MEQESIPANPAQSGRLGDESELQPALARIVDDPGLEATPVELLGQIIAHLTHVIVRVAALGPVGRLIPGPLVHSDHVVTDRDRSDGPRHAGCKEPSFPFSEPMDRDSVRLATRPSGCGLFEYVLETRVSHVH
jgi:hypothetical protein